MICIGSGYDRAKKPAQMTKPDVRSYPGTLEIAKTRKFGVQWVRFQTFSIEVERREKYYVVSAKSLSEGTVDAAAGFPGFRSVCSVGAGRRTTLHAASASAAILDDSAIDGWQYSPSIFK